MFQKIHFCMSQLLSYWILVGAKQRSCSFHVICCVKINESSLIFSDIRLHQLCSRIAAAEIWVLIFSFGKSFAYEIFYFLMDLAYLDPEGLPRFFCPGFFGNLNFVWDYTGQYPHRKENINSKDILDFNTHNYISYFV